MVSATSKGKAEDLFPIDINYAKLSDWVVDRKQTTPDWRKRLQVITAKASAALRDVPPDVCQDSDFDASTDSIDYLRARRIRDQLSSTAEKSLFGGLKGEAGTWDKIVKAYGKGNVFLGEAGKILVQNVDHDIPFFKKQSAKFMQQIADLERKHAEYLRSAAKAAADYQQEAARLGIGTGPVEEELRKLLLQLPAIFDEAVEKLQQPLVQQALELYAAFTSFVTRGADAATDASTALVPAQLLPICQEVLRGETQPYRGGQQGPGCNGAHAAEPDPAATGPAPTAPEPSASAAEVDLTIQWDFDLQDTGGAEVGSEMECRGGEQGEQGVDWAVMEEQEGVEDGEGSAGVCIDWDIEVSEVQEGTADGEEGTGGRKEGSAGGKEGEGVLDIPPCSVAASRLVEDSEYRGALLRELLELRAFLLMRALELDRKGGSAAVLGAPDAVERVGLALLRDMAAAVEGVLGQVQGERARELLLVKGSRSYEERLARVLRQKGGQEAKFKRLAVEVEHKRLELQRALLSDTPKLSRLIKHTAAVKALAEETLSTLLGGRVVNIIGEINNLL